MIPRLMANGLWAILSNEQMTELFVMSFITAPVDETGVKIVYKFKLPNNDRLNWAAMKLDV
jgi:hypothetical protein